ncbi:hypothetical protein EMCRGX_G005252 [Ephydatia muelleri]
MNLQRVRSHCLRTAKIDSSTFHTLKSSERRRLNCLYPDEHTDDFDSSNDEPEYIVSAQQCWPSTNLNQWQYACMACTLGIFQPCQGDGSAESHVTMELYLYLPLSSPAASLNLTGALFFTRVILIDLEPAGHDEPITRFNARDAP